MVDIEKIIKKEEKFLILEINLFGFVQKKFLKINWIYILLNLESLCKLTLKLKDFLEIEIIKKEIKEIKRKSTEKYIDFIIKIY